jgi:hypothetical protein
MRCKECAYREWCATADVSLERVSDILKETLNKARKENDKELIVQTACYIKTVLQRALDLWIDFIDCLTKG